MKLYVGNIPRLANEEALGTWFERAGMYVEAIHLVEEDDSESCAWVKITEERLLPKALRHLKKRVFWGRRLVVQKDEPRSRQQLWPRGGPLASLDISRTESSRESSSADPEPAEKFARLALG